MHEHWALNMYCICNMFARSYNSKYGRGPALNIEYIIPLNLFLSPSLDEFDWFGNFIYLKSKNPFDNPFKRLNSIIYIMIFDNLVFWYNHKMVSKLYLSFNNQMMINTYHLKSSRNTCFNMWKSGLKMLLERLKIGYDLMILI